jgi:hypothetical protein
MISNECWSQPEGSEGCPLIQSGKYTYNTVFKILPLHACLRIKEIIRVLADADGGLL